MRTARWGSAVTGGADGESFAVSLRARAVVTPEADLEAAFAFMLSLMISRSSLSSLVI